MNENIKILVVDDEPNSSQLMKKILLKQGYNVEEENSSSKAKQLIEENDYDLIISDLQMPELSGFDLLKTKPEGSLFIMVTGFGSIDSAVDSMKNGAFDYISKPFNLEEFVLKVRKAADNIFLTRQLARLKSQFEEKNSFSNIIGNSKKMQNVFEFIKNVAKTKVNVLLEGQSGTGKELVSRAIHSGSSRNDGPFVAINCSAIPDNLLESELFGHAKGAFTGATDHQKGVFEQANYGTILLDEIAEMPIHLQSKLLRVIENWEIKPIGSDRLKKVDVRLIAATNQNLKEMVAQKKFRADLYYRISTVSISLPTLNERREDIPLLANHILKKLSEKFERNLSIDASAMETLLKYDWKGNVRELENIIERSVISSATDKLDRNSFRFINSMLNNENDLGHIEGNGLKEVEKFFIKRVLEENSWNKLKVSKLLGIDRKTLYKKIKEYKLE